MIYKRTDKGDPDREGRFGICDCMGTVRSRKFDAVIGIGGIGRQATAEDIDGKVNWIGLGAKKGSTAGSRGAPLVTFDHFVLFEEKGRDFRAVAPILARRIYSKNVRVLSNFNDAEQEEIDRILKMATASPPSSGPMHTRMGRCVPKRPC
jgi:hypothetical protein